MRFTHEYAKNDIPSLSRLYPREAGLPLFIWSLVACLAVPIPSAAWPGHDWEQWRDVTTWSPPDVRTAQAGRNLPVLLLQGEQGGDDLNGIRAWEERRARYADAIQRILGSPTGLERPTASGPTATPIEVKVIREEELEDHVRRHIRIRTEPDDWIPAYLLVPRPMPTTPVPAMICLHQTVARGKEEPCGIKGDPDMAFALELVRRGFVCIAPDVIGFGERIPPGTQPYHNSLEFYRRHPGWSFMGKMIWDVGTLIDYLETLPFVDPLQIGSIGHSHGAYGTLFAAAFEPRIALAVASCGFTTFRQDPSPERWSHATALIPQLGMYLPDVEQIPFDWQHICALIAPRPLFVWYATRDSIFPETENLGALFRDVQTVYGLYGAADDLAWHAYEGAHRFPDEGRKRAYDWLEDRLFRVGDLGRMPATVEQVEEQRELTLRVIRRTIGDGGRLPASVDLRVLTSGPVLDFTRHLVNYKVDRRERVPAYLCLPAEPSGKRPGVLVLHQTTPLGKDESALMGGDESLAFATDLAERGCVTLAPDSITAGERIDAFGPFDTRGYYLEHPDLSAMGKMLYDAQVGLTALAGHPRVDPERLGVIGHSLGAEVALMLAAFDERVTACAASCGYATFKAEQNRLRWARDQWFSYMPKLRPVFQQGRLPHWDWDDVLRCIAPRALFQHTTRDDEIFTKSKSAYDAGERVRPVWELYRQPDRFVNVLEPGKHAIAEETKREMYRWLDRQLVDGIRHDRTSKQE